MNRSRQRCSVFGRHKTHALVAGLVWHPLLSSDPQEREQGVWEFCQSYDARQLVVTSDDHCLQIGYAPNPQLLKEYPMVLSFHSIAVEIRLLSQADVVLSLIRLDEGDYIGHYSVVLFEKAVLVLDMVSTGLEASGVYENYRSLFGPNLTFEIYSNDPETFPESKPIAIESLQIRLHQQSLLRKPRRPRMQAGWSLDWKVAAKYGAGLLVAAAAAWLTGGLFIDLNAKKQLSKAEQSERDYLRAVQVGLTQLGLQTKGVNEVLDALQEIPLVYEGWQLLSVTCAPNECTQTWRGEPFWLAEELAPLGQIRGDKAETQWLEVQVSKPIQATEVGRTSTMDLPTRKQVNLLCKRETAFFRDLKISVKCDAQGKPWPRKADGVKPELLVTEHSFEVTVDPAELSFLLDRIGGEVFWREFTIRLADAGRHGSGGSAVMYELKGALYAYK